MGICNFDELNFHLKVTGDPFSRVSHVTIFYV